MAIRWPSALTEVAECGMLVPLLDGKVSLKDRLDDRLQCRLHDAVTVTSQYENFYRQETGWSGLLYKCANAKYTHKLARLDLATSCDMRAPSAAPGVYALSWSGF